MTETHRPAPPLNWELLQAMMAGASGRSEAWRHAGSWALNKLQDELGDDWPAWVASKNPGGGAPLLAWASGHVVAYAQVVELALRLELLRDAPGIAKLRRTLRNDPRPAQLVHCEMQLEVASLALRAGILPELEPAGVSSRPADVAFSTGPDHVVVEARAILASDQWKKENDWTDWLFGEIRKIEARHGVRCEGEVTEFLDEDSAEGLLQAVESRARLVAAGLESPALHNPGAALAVVRQEQAPAHGLRGPHLGGDSWLRIESRIRQKVDGAVDSGANWLRLDARDGLWQFTQWSAQPLADKLRVFDAAASVLLGGMEGMVLSCGPLLRQGTFLNEDVVRGSVPAAIRRCLPFVRVRETLLIRGAVGAGSVQSTWAALYSEEPTWLDWALGRVGLPSSGEILDTRRGDIG